MMGVDLALLVSAPLAIGAAGDRAALVGGFYVVAYLASGPIHPPRPRRLGGGTEPVPPRGDPAARPGRRRMIAFAMIQGCGDNLGCAVGPGLALLAGGLIGVLAAVIPDWAAAHVEAAPTGVAPLISSDGERTLFGLGGRF